MVPGEYVLPVFVVFTSTITSHSRATKLLGHITEKHKQVDSLEQAY